MREGFDAPAETIPDDELERIRSFLDAQARVDLAVWVRHEHQGVDGRVYDHHLVLGISDDDYASGDMWALELGIELGPPLPDRPGWLDIFPVSEVEALRSFATTVWERNGRPRRGDPLDFRLTWEPLEVEGAVAERFGELVRAVDGVDRIEGTLERLWKNGYEVRHGVQLFLDFRYRRPRDFEEIRRAASESGLETAGMSAGLPRDPAVRTATVYEASR